MASMGASGVSLAIGLYNTSQISSLKESVESLKASAPGNISTLLSPTVVDTPEVIKTTPKIKQESFVPSSSSDITQIQKRLESLESFSNVVSEDSTANSSNLSNKVFKIQTSMSDLEIFANIASTRSTTNEMNITLNTDDLTRLSSFTSEEIINAKDRISGVEDSANLNKSNIGLLQKGSEDHNEDIIGVNNRVDNLELKQEGTESSMGVMESSILQSAGDIQQLSTNITTLVSDADAIGDLITLVDGNEQETRSNLEALTGSWNTLSTKAFVDRGKFNVTDMQATKCNLSLVPNQGNTSAIHFAELDSHLYTMYASSPVGKGPDNIEPKKHGTVTKQAIRIRTSNEKDSGFIMERGDGVPVFSVSSVGDMTTNGSANIGHGRVFNLSSEWTSFGHKNQKFTFGSKSNGEVVVNGTNLVFRNSEKPVMNIAGGGININNQENSNSTHFNYDKGTNYIVAAPGNGTYFRFGKNTGNVVEIKENGLTVHGMNIKHEIEALKAEIKALKSHNSDLDKKVVKNGQIVYLKNKNNGKFVTKADSNDDIVVNRGSRANDKSRFYIET